MTIANKRKIKKSPTLFMTQERARRLVAMFERLNSIKGMTMMLLKGYGANKGKFRIVLAYQGKVFSTLKAY